MAEQLLKLFSRDIQKNLFPDNAFYKHSKLDGGVNVKAKTIEVPQSGAEPTILTNPSSFPLTIGTRTDDTKTYTVDLFATQPIHIEDENEIVTNYSKRQDITQDQSMALNARIADNMAYAWSPDGSDAAKILKTTGANRPSSVSGGDAKKAVTYDDIVALGASMDGEDIPSDGRYLLAGAQMYSDLLKINEFISFDYKSKAVSSGAIGSILGFTVYKRSRAAVYNDSFTIKTVGATAATTDRDSILAWHESFVRRAEGNVKVYSDENSPEYLGSIYNAAVRSGGMIGRLDERGVFSLVQETGV